MSEGGPPIALAATVILLRPEAEGFSVFMVKRHGRAGFLPSVWVFPGGRVEASDAELPERWTVGGAATDPAARAVLVGAARETFEEAGVWLGEDAPPEVERHRLARGQVSLLALLEAHGGTLHLDRLRPWSRWVTPLGEPRRFDTSFLLAVVEGQHGLHDAHETVDSAWLRPAEALMAGVELPLAPPTWWTLRELSAHRSVADVLAAPRDLAPIRPVLDLSSGAFGITLPGHPTHPEPPRADLPRRIALIDGAWAALD